MSSIKISVSIGGYKTPVSESKSDLVEIDVPIPEQRYKDIPAYDYRALVGVVADKASEVITAVRTPLDNVEVDEEADE